MPSNISEYTNLKPASSFTCTTMRGAVKLRIGVEGLSAIAPKTIPQFFRQACRDFARRPALCYEEGAGDWSVITYGDYERKVEQAALMLIYLGLEPRRSVGVLAANCPEWFYVELGGIIAGGVIAGIYPTSSPEAVCHILKTAEATVCVVDNAMQMAKVRAVRRELPQLKAVIQLNDPYDDFMDLEEGYYRWSDLAALQFDNSIREKLRQHERNIGANQCAILSFTSGTTGMPKAAMITHDSMLMNIKYTHSTIGCLERGSEVTVSYLPLNHIAAQMFEVFLSLENGDCVYFADRNALKGTLIRTLLKARPTRLFGVPRVFEKLQERISQVELESMSVTCYFMDWARNIVLDHYMKKTNESKLYKSLKYRLAANFVYKLRSTLGLDRCKSLIAGSAPMALETKQFFMGLQLPVADMYGLTESSGGITLVTDPTDFYSVGRAYQGMEMKIAEPDSDGCGEIFLRGRCIIMGYLKEPAKTKETIDAEGWLHTGDLGHMTEDGLLTLTGRLKELIITSGGENVPPVRIENLVKHELPCISNALLIGDKRKYLTILLTFKTEMDQQTGMPLDTLLPDAVSWFQDLGYNFKRLSEVLKVPANLTEIEAANIVVKPEFCVLEAIQEALDRVNEKALSRAQKIQKFTFLPHDFSMPTGELGPTLKVRRQIITKKYCNAIERMYY